MQARESTAVTANQKHVTVQVDFTSAKEWRWVITISLLLLAAISLPFAWAFYVDVNNPDVQFMGFLMNPLDGGTYLSKIQLGREGIWRTVFRHSPQVTDGAYLDVFYTTMGQAARLLGLNSVSIFHITRLLVALLMFFTLYNFAAIVWQRERSRRLFFILVTVGSGLGWLIFPFTQSSPDIAIPEAFPLYSAIVNPHFPLAIAMLATAAGILVRLFRPGFDDEPTLRNGGLLLPLIGLFLAIIAPHALIPLTAAMAAVMGIEWFTKRRIIWRYVSWMLLLVIPAAPFAFYYLAEVRYNPIVAEWSAQNVTRSPNLLVYLAGFGLPLVLALPGIWRAVRRFEPDGDQFMLLWLIALVGMSYFPVDAQRRFSMGVMIPIVYFAVRALEDFWMTFGKRSQKWRKRAVGVLVGASAMTYLLLLTLLFWGSNAIQQDQFYLNNDYINALDWIQTQTPPNTVILAADTVGTWIPGESGMSVVYGHPFETLNAEENQALVKAWYAAEQSDDSLCNELITRFDVRYIIAGPSEQRDDNALGCVAERSPLQQFGDVDVYAP